MLFSLIEDVVSFTGPQGDVTPTGFAWVDERTLEIYLEERAAVLYMLVLGRHLGPLRQRH